MFNSPIFEVVIGMFFIYLFLSLLSSGIQSWIAGLKDSKSNLLYDTLKKILNDGKENLVDDFYAHHLIATIPSDEKKQTNIPAQNFSLAMLDIIEKKVKEKFPDAADDLEEMIDKFENNKFKQILQPIYNEALAVSKEKVAEVFRKKLDEWYDETTQMLGLVYKKKTALIRFIVAIVICVSLNADTFEMSRILWKNPQLRQTLAAAAEASIDYQAQPQSQPQPSLTEEQIKNILNNVDYHKLPIGWNKKEFIADFRHPENREQFFKNFLMKLAGLLITAGAVSMGAPFWFTILKKMLNLRKTGKK